MELLGSPKNMVKFLMLPQEGTLLSPPPLPLHDGTHGTPSPLLYMGVFTKAGPIRAPSA